jgi:dolichyl-phosphate-mannose-protein mannosyltransferase
MSNVKIRPSKHGVPSLQARRPSKPTAQNGLDCQRDITTYSSTLCIFFHLLQLKLRLPNRSPMEFYHRIKGLSTPKQAFVSGPATDGVIHTETAIAALLIGVAITLKIVCDFHYRIDSDESQHLHVVWSWTQGMLPYRDVFDNHSPLFYALCAALFQLFGERADILIPMRLAMIPLFAVGLYLAWKIGAAVFSPRAGLWAAVLTACYPPYFLTSTEFRPDNLWTVVWLVIILILSSGQPKPNRAFFAGLLLGISFCISMKTVLLAITVVCALGMTWVLRHCFGDASLGGIWWLALSRR